jgi:dihydroorotase-like cyclic amidohydrolase
MSDVEVHGPIDFLLIEFVGDQLQGATAAAMADLVERGIVRLYDLAVIRKGADGSVEALELTADALGGFGAFAGAQSGLLSADDVAEAAEALNAGTTAVLIVYENAWAIPFVAAALQEGGMPVATARIPAVDVIAVLDELDASA